MKISNTKLLVSVRALAKKFEDHQDYIIASILILSLIPVFVSLLAIKFVWSIGYYTAIIGAVLITIAFFIIVLGNWITIKIQKTINNILKD